MIHPAKPRTRNGEHPTKRKLRDAVVGMMEVTPPEDIHSEYVLRETNISRGSLYHHYEDFTDLLEDAMLYRFSAGVEASTGAIENIVETAGDREEFFSMLEGVTRATQARNRSDIRFDRARMLSMAQHNERFHRKLGLVQDRLTDSLTTCIAQAQAKGWVNTSFQARTLAVFIQAYTLGKIVNDVGEQQMDDSDWEGLITLIADRALSSKANAH
jgi:AcrR family transcriptional regulator